MIITPIKTDAIRVGMFTLEHFIDTFVPTLHENDVVVVTSKVVSLCEGAVVTTVGTNRDALVQSEADFFLPPNTNPYGFHITIKKNTLIASAGIDESNGDGHYILWPTDPQQSANTIREFVCSKFQLQKVGVVITDSHIMPLRWGTVGTAIAHSGFQALNSYIGKPDIFGRKLKVTSSNVAEGIAAAAVVVMGEGNEQTPLALVSDADFIHFQDRNPTQEELASLAISKEEDIFAPFLNAVQWETEK